MRFTVQNDWGGRSRWWLWSRNGHLLAMSGDAFDRASNATRAALSFKAGARGWTYEVYADPGSSYRWRARSTNGAHVASSGEPFASRSSARRAADNVRTNAGSAAGP